MTTYPVPFPSHIGPARIALRGRNVVGMTAAPMSGAQQTQDFGGKWWLGEITWPAMDRNRADPVLAWLDSMNGMKGTFTMGHPKRRQSKGVAATAPGLPKVAGGGQTGYDLNFDNGTADDVDEYLKAGDMVQIGTGLYRLEADVDLTYGAGILHLWPLLRTSPADNAPIVVANPVGLFRLSVNEIGDETDEAGTVTIPTVPFIEAL